MGKKLSTNFPLVKPYGKVGFDAGGEGQTGSPVYTKYTTENGTEYYVFLNNDGQYRISTSIPVSNTSGTPLPTDWGVIQRTTVTLNTSNLTNLHTTGVDFVAAQGANTIIQPIHVVYQYTYETAAFTPTTTPVIVMGYAGGAAVISVNAIGFLDQTSSQVRANNATGTAYTPSINTKVRALITGGSLSGGGTSSVVATLLYRVIEL